MTSSEKDEVDLKRNDPDKQSYKDSENGDKDHEKNAQQEEEMKRNMFVAARGHVQRVIDVSLLVSNMSRLAVISVRWQRYEFYQVILLVTMLLVSITAQVVAGVCFFITHQGDIYRRSLENRCDIIAFTCVGVVMVANIFISTFDATWSSSA